MHKGEPMTDPRAIPSRDPANDDSLIGMARQILGKFLAGVDDMLPARVVSYDRASNRATVVPMVKLLTTDGRQVGRAQLASIPVFRYGGGGVVLSFPIQPGDLGWIKASDRDISLVLQGGNDSAPNTLRKHKFEDGMFIPDVFSGVTITAEDDGHAVLQTLDGGTRLSIWDEYIKITAPGGLFVSDTTGAPSQNTILDVKSTVKGARPWPKMTTAERDAIPVTAADEGLAVWNVTTHALSTYNGTSWS